MRTYASLRMLVRSAKLIPIMIEEAYGYLPLPP